MVMDQREHYYTEVGIKIHHLRFSVRFPGAASLKLGSSSSSNIKDETNWKWIPQQKHDYPMSTTKSSSTSSSLESVSFCPDGSSSSMSAPPVPPRSGSPTTPPPSALPPYPSSTVSRRRPTSTSAAEVLKTRRICSYVWNNYENRPFPVENERKKNVIIRVKPISSYIRHKEEAKIEANKKIILKRSLNSFCSPFFWCFIYVVYLYRCFIYIVKNLLKSCFCEKWNNMFSLFCQ